MSEDRKLLLQFIASLTLCDHMGDVLDDVGTVLKRIGCAIDEGEYEGEPDPFLAAVRSAMIREGVTTLYGTTL